MVLQACRQMELPSNVLRLVHQFELPRLWSPVRVVAESEPIHQASRQATQRASRAWPAAHQFEKLARRELLGAENFHLDTKVPHTNYLKRRRTTADAHTQLHVRLEPFNVSEQLSRS